MIEKPITDYDEEVRNCSCSYCGNNCDDITYLLKDKKIVIVDDVTTTGATAEIIASRLKKAGAKQVFLITVASTPPIEKY